MFDDLLESNRRFRQDFVDPDVPGEAGRGLAVVTCIDSRVDPWRILGLSAGDAKVFRNAGAWVTDDALRSVVLAVNLLGAERVAVIHHTECAMVGRSDDEVRARIGELRGADASGWVFWSSDDQRQALADDLAALRSCELLPDDLAVGGFVYDVRTGELVLTDL